MPLCPVFVQESLFSIYNVLPRPLGLIKKTIKKQHPNKFQGGSPWATLILNSMFVVVVLYCVQLLPEVAGKISNIPFTTSFAKAFFFNFLSSILLEFSEMSNFPKYKLPD